jgi:hypothetical protein
MPGTILESIMLYNILYYIILYYIILLVLHILHILHFRTFDTSLSKEYKHTPICITIHSHDKRISHRIFGDFYFSIRKIYFYVLIIH